MVRARILLLAVITQAGCFIGDISLEGKSCPCAEPAVCDTIRNICVMPGNIVDAGASDALPDDDATVPEPDAGFADAADEDAAGDDAGAEDMGVPPEDTGVEDTGVEEEDAGEVDTGVADTGVADTGVIDTGPRDTGVVDTGPRDTGVVDTGPADTGVIDTGTPDTGVPDTGPPDTGTPDTGPPDAAPAASLALGDACTYDAECSTGICLDVDVGPPSRICVRGCSATSDCPLDFSCQTVDWSPYCLPENVFSPVEQFNTPSGMMCALGSETCQSGSCDGASSTCTERCTRESDCASFGGICATFTPDPRGLCLVRGSTAAGGLCASDPDCETGICNRTSSRCAAHCCTELDCGATETCDGYNTGGSTIVKICRARRMPPGSLNLGDTCVNNGDCESEACVSLSTAGGFPKQCSVTCCEDSDCAVMPGGARCYPFPYGSMGAELGYCVP